MHNRMRMITASFLVKDLHIDWTRGARHFMDHLIDGDVASKQHGWQWTAGTGTAIRNQSAPVLVYPVDGQRILQGSVIRPDLDRLPEQPGEAVANVSRSAGR